MMESDLIQFDYEWREGDRGKARQIAKDYINRRRDELAPIFSKYTLEGLVDQVTALRNAGRHADRIIVDMWLLSEFEPQNITGELVIDPYRLAVAAAEAILRGEQK